MNKLHLQEGKTIGSQINTIYDEVVAGTTPDGSQLFVFHNQNGSNQIGYANYKGNYRFEPLDNFGSPLDAKGSEYGMWMTNSKDAILFSSENEKGNTDLYYSIKLPTGEWGKAHLLPGKINSVEYKENFPILSSDGKRIYFSSDNAQSMGGYDLFYANWNDETQSWSVPVNLGYPINDTYDNFNISWVNGQRHAYISAIRPEGHGHRDIYKVVFNSTLPSTAIVKCNIRLKKDRKLTIPDFNPTSTFTDTLNNLIGTYATQDDSASFIMALITGNYIIKIKHDLIQDLDYQLNIPDNYFNTLADRIKLIVLPKKKSL